MNLVERAMNNQPKILIIDEHSDDRYILAYFLRYCEFDVEEKNNDDIELIVTEVDRFKPDVIILSERSSSIDGYHIYSILEKIYKNQKFYTILLVDEITEQSRKLVHRKGINEVVSRPRLTDKEYSYFKITEFVHKNIIDLSLKKDIKS